MNFISEKPSWPERVALGRIATSTLCVSAVRLRCSSRDLTWVTLSQVMSPVARARGIRVSKALSPMKKHITSSASEKR